MEQISENPWWGCLKQEEDITYIYNFAFSAYTYIKFA